MFKFIKTTKKVPTVEVWALLEGEPFKFDDKYFIKVSDDLAISIRTTHKEELHKINIPNVTQVERVTLEIKDITDQ